VDASSGITHKSPVGVSLLAIAVHQTTTFCLNRRHREQARSHRFRGGRKLRDHTQIPCRSEPARDSGTSVNNDSPELTPSRAGSLPQVLRWTQALEPHAHPMWERACSRSRHRSLEKHPTAQEVAQLVVIFHGINSLQTTPGKACSQVRKKLRSTAQLLAHYLLVSTLKTAPRDPQPPLRSRRPGT
jgi:hypothetical protein